MKPDGDVTIELDPKCFTDQVGLAVTNRGHLIPCCYLDDPRSLADERYKTLLKVSKLSENESLEAIVAKKEWIDFYEALKNNEGPALCQRVCKKEKTANELEIKKAMNPKENRLIYQSKH